MPAQRDEVLLTEGAEQDLEELCDYIAEFDSIANADLVLDRPLEVAESLEQFPERGAFPKELLELGFRDYRQTSFKPYRIIYRVLDLKVYIHLIVDGRRNTQSLLLRRVLGK